MSYLDLFQRYGNPSREAEIRLTAYLLRPDALTADRIKAHDDSAARMIARCNELIDQLSEYRQALAARYAALATAAYHDRLELIRDPGYRGKPVLYFVRIVRTYEDGTTERVIDEKYFGTERRKKRPASPNTGSRSFHIFTATTQYSTTAIKNYCKFLQKC